MNIRMRFTQLIMCVLLCATVTLGARPRTAKSLTPGQFQSAVRQLLRDPALKRANIGISIVSTANGRKLFDHNSGQFFHPASTAKIFTTAAALGILGPNWTFTTPLLAGGPVHDNVLDGTLVVLGSGDPLFLASDADTLAHRIASLGIRRIAGGIVGNVSLFDSTSWGQGWMWDDEPDPDEAFISPLTIERNSLTATIAPADTAGGRPLLSTSPATTYVTLVNDAQTTNDSRLPECTILRLPLTNTIVARGRVAPRQANVEVHLSLRQPAMYFLGLLADRLWYQGITLQGRVRVDTVGDGLPLAQISRRLDTVVTVINKESYNLGAENLLRILAAERHGRPGKAEDGIEVVREFLASLGVDTSGVSLVDGSGVSWYNLATPQAFTQTLAGMAKRSPHFQTFLGSLPVSGVDGTLQNRLKSHGGSKSVHAKTGTLSGVSTLAGYARTGSGTLCAFSILCEHLPGEVHRLRDLQDHILDLLARVR